MKNVKDELDKLHGIYPYLSDIAKQKNKRVKRWVGYRQGPLKRTYICYVCGQPIHSESAIYPMMKHSYNAIFDHGRTHHSE